MAGFQIPGLGNAKPDEKLPPLPASQAISAPSAPTDPSPDVEITDAPSEPKGPEPAPSDDIPKDTPREHATMTTEGESMALDQPPSPPSLTGALEAALGGLPGEDAERALARTLGAQEPQVQQQPEGAGQQNGEADHPEWEADSSPYESSSVSSSSVSSSDEDSDNEGYELLGVQETARLLMEAEGGSDDEGDRGKPGTSSAALRTKNEMPEEIIPRPDVTITPEMKIEELGVVEHIVEDMVLIKAFTPGEYQVLDSGSVLCNSERIVVGAVAETIGKVIQPMYTVRFNSADEIAGLGIEVGTKIFYPVDHASFVFTEPLKGLKGSDASNLHDEEVGDDEMEFSDDEKEAEYKRSLKEKKRKKAATRGAPTGGREPHPLRQELGPSGELNYDDGAAADNDDDGPYKPLTRPPGFGSGPVSQETYEPTHRPNFRGRGRGDSRGRGPRGRGGRSGNRGGRGGRDGYSLPQSQHHSQQQPQSPQPRQDQATAPPPLMSPQGWNMPQQGAAPTMPNFGLQFPGWPPAQGGQPVAPPPPPPGWPGSPQGQQAQAQPGGAFMNPALLAALMSHMQQQQGQQQPPPGGQGQ